MGAVIVLVETNGPAVRSSSLPAISAAQELAKHHGGSVVGVVIGAGIGPAAADAARYLPRVIAFDDPALGAPLPETWAPVLAQTAKDAGASAVVATASALGKDVLPRVAALLEAGMASEIVGVLAGNRFRRPTHAGNALQDIEVATPTMVVTARQTGFPPAEATASAGAVEAGTVGTVDTLGAEYIALHATESTRPDLGEAKVVVSGGRGMKEGKNFAALEELTDLLGGALGASRAATDAGMVPAELQVGQTGRVVAPELYIAVAISGAIQHLAGMKSSKVIVAINKDPEAPIFQVADYGLVAQWESAIPELTAEIKKIKAAG